jgi:predicted nucleotidyltransferase
MARGEETKSSDIDLLVKFNKSNKIGLFELDKLQGEFEKRLGKKVDLVTKVNKYIEPYIKKDLKTIYEKK